MSDLKRIPSIHPHMRLQWEPSQNAYILLFPEGMVKLNESGAHILKLCDGKNTVESMIQNLCATFPDATEALAQDVSAFIKDCINKGWLLWQK